MPIMPKQKIQTFNDGVLSLYIIGEDERLKLQQQGLRFSLRTVGSKRFFEAMQQQHRADKVVRIPLISEPSANSVALIGDKQYIVLQVQEILDTFPKCWQLTLEEIKRGNYHDIHTDA